MKKVVLTGISLAFACTGVWSACAGQIPHLTPQQIQRARERWPEIDAGDLQRGRSLYVARCGGCHNLYPPASIPAGKWPRIVDEMSERANLRAGQREAILRYLLAVTPP